MSVCTTRCGVLAGLTTNLALYGVPSLAGRRPLIEMFRDPGRDCCWTWGEIMQRAGFDVAVQEVDRDTPARLKPNNGIPERLMSGHTGQVDGTWSRGMSRTRMCSARRAGTVGAGDAGRIAGHGIARRSRGV